jgi:plastocyanin
MPRWIRYSLFPAAVAFAALFIALPQTGADTTIKIVSTSGVPAYTPGTFSVKAGARVAFENDTRQTQTATCLNCTPKATWDSGDIQPGQTVFVTLPDVATAFDFASRYDEALQGRLLAGVTEEASPSPSPAAS